MSHKRESYASDITDQEWHLLEGLLRGPKKAGRPMRLALREVVNAMFYVVRTGCQWRQLPHDFPNYQSVYYHYRKWCHDGTWRAVNRALVYERRRAQGRLPHPSGGVIDSQSVKTTEVGGERGYDAWKHIHGRKRHVLVDTQGNLLEVRVSPAHWQDRAGARALFEQLHPMLALRLQRVWADRAYEGAWTTWLADDKGIAMEVVAPPPGKRGFQSLPRRWVVERTLGWLGRSRRLSKDYERCAACSEGMIFLASVRRLLMRLAA